MKNLIEMYFDAEDSIKEYKKTYNVYCTEDEFKEWNNGLKAMKNTKKEIKKLILKLIK